MLVFPFPTSPCFSEPPVYRQQFICICPYCLEQWAVCHREGDMFFQLNAVDCPSCAYDPTRPQHNAWNTPGSILESLMRCLGQDRFEDSEQYISQVLDSLPPDVIRSEFNTAIKAFQFNQEPSYLL